MATPIPRNRAPFEAAEIAEACGATVAQAPARAIEGVSTDSRGLAPGNLFVALRGEAHDGHDHVARAVEAGASAVLVDHVVEAPAGLGVFVARDTLEALGALASFHRRRFHGPLVAITGSVGKTTTKELVAAALTGAGHHVLSTRGNLNNRVGVPMTLFTIDVGERSARSARSEAAETESSGGPGGGVPRLEAPEAPDGIEREHDAAVIELGMSVPGEIAALAAIAGPTIGIVTAIEAVHTEGVGGLAGVRHEKGALLASLGPEASAIWGADYELDAYARGAGRRLRYGTREDADVRLVSFELDGHEATRARVSLPSREAVELTLPLLGEAAATSAAAALAVIHLLAPDAIDAAAAALAGVPRVPQRLVPIELASGPLVLDDTYNASPASTRAALATGAAIAASRGGALIAVLGDMLELGREEATLHAEVGRDVVRAGAATLIACGERMTHAGRAALSASMDAGGRRTRVVLLRNVDDAAACVIDVVKPADVVLVKGSRGMRMERVVEALEAVRER